MAIHNVTKNPVELTICGKRNTENIEIKKSFSLKKKKVILHKLYKNILQTREEGKITDNSIYHKSSVAVVKYLGGLKKRHNFIKRIYMRIIGYNKLVKKYDNLAKLFALKPAERPVKQELTAPEKRKQIKITPIDASTVKKYENFAIDLDNSENFPPAEAPNEEPPVIKKRERFQMHVNSSSKHDADDYDTYKSKK
jgi:hypothetical protein